MSLLRSEGHPDALHYPLGMLFDEAAIVEERANARIITDAHILQQAIASILSKEARRGIKKMLRSLEVQVRANPAIFGAEDFWAEPDDEGEDRREPEDWDSPEE